MKSRSTQEKIAGDRGSRKLPAGAYTQTELGKGFYAFRTSEDGAAVSVLKAVSDAADDLTAGADVLDDHIESAPTTLIYTADLIECQLDSFTEITSDKGFTVFF